MQLSTSELKQIPVFGIAGNFAEHLSQAGEDADFVNIETEEANAPKGIFPIFLPNHDSFLKVFPLSHNEIKADFSQPINLHMEPEMCVLFDVCYENDEVSQLLPRAFNAFNDCSIRKPNAQKISEKKNWGEICTGIGENWCAIDKFESGSVLDDIHIASYLRRSGQVIQYGINSPVTGYQYFYAKLLNWMVKTLNMQKDFGPLEALNDYLKQLEHPKQIIISLGATRYTEFGETGFLEAGDEIGIFVYNQQQSTEVDTALFFANQKPANEFTNGSALIQKVEKR